MAKIEIDQLSEAIADTLEEWKDAKYEELEEVSIKHGKELLNRVKRDSPKRERGGAYRRNWRMETTKIINGEILCTIYNKKHYRLTHLLEHGHVTRNGTSRTKAIPHLLKNEEEVGDEFHKEVAEMFSK